MSENKSTDVYQKKCSDLINIMVRHIQIFLSGKVRLFNVTREIYYKNYEYYALKRIWHNTEDNLLVVTLDQEEFSITKFSDIDFVETAQKILKTELTDEQVIGCHGDYDIEYTFIYPNNPSLLTEDELKDSINSTRVMFNEYCEYVNFILDDKKETEKEK